MTVSGQKDKDLTEAEIWGIDLNENYHPADLLGKLPHRSVKAIRRLMKNGIINNCVKTSAGWTAKGYWILEYLKSNCATPENFDIGRLPVKASPPDQ